MIDQTRPQVSTNLSQDFGLLYFGGDFRFVDFGLVRVSGMNCHRFNLDCIDLKALLLFQCCILQTRTSE